MRQSGSRLETLKEVQKRREINKNLDTKYKGKKDGYREWAERQKGRELYERVSEEKWGYIMLQVIELVKWLEERHVYHGDISLESVMVDLECC